MKNEVKNTNESQENNKITIEEYLRNKYQFRINVFTSAIEYKLISMKVFKVMKDNDLNSLVRELNANKIKIRREAMYNLLKSDFTPEYHPLKKYLDSIKPWDNKTDHISELATRISTDDDEFFVEAFKKWFVAMVGSGLDDFTFNHSMIIFSGSQGIGKSTFIRNLLPEGLRDYCYSGMIYPNSKDTLINLSECLIIDLDELSSLTSKGNNGVKELITKSKIKVRRPYERIPELLVRRASFIGSVNEEAFLTDLTGNRRYLCFIVEAIDYKTTVNYEGVYSQAYALYKSGFKYYFDGEDIKKINNRNETFRSKSTIEELVLSKYMRAKNKFKAELYLSSSELLEKLNKDSNISMSNTSTIQLGKVLTKLNFEKVKKNGLSKYAIDYIRDNEQSLRRVS